QVCVPTTPAQVFHMLRRQIIRPLRTPLVVMTTNSLLRHKEAASSLEELADGTFHYVLPETDDLEPGKGEGVVLWSGKVCDGLRAKRREKEIQDIGIGRLEQMYPYSEEEVGQLTAPYTELEDVVWCQEEPQNMGAW